MSEKYNSQELASFIPHRNHSIPIVFEDKRVTINLKELSDILWGNDVPQYDYHFIDAPILEAYVKGIGWCFQRIIDLSKDEI